MTRRGAAWLCLVFCLTVLAELPASWLGLPAQGVVGSLWQGQASQWGAVGPLRWELQPWRMQAHIAFSFQGQGWQARISGWPWRWQGSLATLGGQSSTAQGYRLAGHWQGALQVQGAGRVCQAASGRITVNDLALAEPWSLGLGQGAIEMTCQGGWRLTGNLGLAGQHALALDADLLARRARLNIEVQPDAALTPVLRGVQWLGVDALRGQREVRW